MNVFSGAAWLHLKFQSQSLIYLKLGNPFSLKLLVPVMSWFMNLSPGFLSTDHILDLELSFNIPFPFWNCILLKVVACISFSCFVASFFPLFITYLVTNKTINQTIYTFLKFCISVTPKGFYFYNIYCWAACIQLIFSEEKITYPFFIYTVFYCTLPLGPEAEVHNARVVAHFRVVSPQWSPGVVPNLGVGGGSPRMSCVKEKRHSDTCWSGKETLFDCLDRCQDYRNRGERDETQLQI